MIKKNGIYENAHTETIENELNVDSFDDSKIDDPVVESASEFVKVIAFFYSEFVSHQTN